MHAVGESAPSADAGARLAGLLTSYDRCIRAHATDYVGYDDATARVMRAIVTSNSELHAAAEEARRRRIREENEARNLAQLQRAAEMNEDPRLPRWGAIDRALQAHSFYGGASARETAAETMK